MSPRKIFDRFMVTNDNGRSWKWAELTDGEFRALIQGILPIASEASPRGAFMVGRRAATADDVIRLAPKVKAAAARSAIKKLRDLEILEHDDELGAEWVHDFDDYNPAPKADPTGAERQARFRARNADRNGGGNGPSNGSRNAKDRYVTPGKVEVEVEAPPLPPAGGRSRSRQIFKTEMTDWAQRHFPGIHPSEVQGLASWMRSRGETVTADSMRSYAAAHEKWSGVLGRGISDEQRDQIAAAGAKVIELNARAEA